MSADSLALGVYGSLTPHDRPVGVDDCFSAFVALTSTLGWLSSPADSGRGLWGMNDAGGPWFAEDATLVGLFQVSPLGHGHAPLPVEPFVAAAVTTLERFGTLGLHGVELFVPLAGAGPAGRHLAAGHGWYGLAAPVARTRLRITLDSGGSPAVVERVDGVVRALADIAPNEEGLDAHRASGVPPADFATPVPWRWWLGAGEPHVVTLSAVASEWTSLGIGRVVACLIEACRAAGISDPLGIRLVRDRPDRAHGR